MYLTKIHSAEHVVETFFLDMSYVYNRRGCCNLHSVGEFRPRPRARALLRSTLALISQNPCDTMSAIDHRGNA